MAEDLQILPYANSPHHLDEILGIYLFPIQAGTNTGADGLPQMKYVTGAELQAFARKGLGNFANFVGTLTELPETAVVNDYFLAGADFGDYLKDHYYEYNGSEWFDVSGILSQYATASSVADILVRLVLAESDIDDLQADVTVLTAGIVYRDSCYYSALPASPAQGDCYWVIDRNAFCAWNGTAWKELTASYLVVDSLDSTSTTNALSAAKGKELNDKFGGFDLSEETDPAIGSDGHGEACLPMEGSDAYDDAGDSMNSDMFEEVEDAGAHSLRFLDASPASSSAEGEKYDAYLGADYLYLCVSDNTWKRVALSTF